MLLLFPRLKLLTFGKEKKFSFINSLRYINLIYISLCYLWMSVRRMQMWCIIRWDSIYRTLRLPNYNNWVCFCYRRMGKSDDSTKTHPVGNFFIHRHNTTLTACASNCSKIIFIAVFPHEILFTLGSWQGKKICSKNLHKMKEACTDSSHMFVLLHKKWNGWREICDAFEMVQSLSL